MNGQLNNPIGMVESFSILLDDLNTPKYFAKLHELFDLASKGDKSKKDEFNEGL